MIKKQARGGARKGSGRKLIYGEETVLIQYKVPVSKKEEIKEKIEKILKKYEVRDRT